MLHHLKDKVQATLQSSSTRDALTRSVPVSDITFSPPSFLPLTAGIELCDRTFNYFYTPKHEQFSTPHDEPGTINSHHGYVVWPVAIAFWAIADCAKRSGRREDMEDLNRAFQSLEKHWSDEEKGYCSWMMSPGNRDIYFDDNVHCGNALVTAYQATTDVMFLNRAKDLLTGVVSKGWDRSDNPGGMAWHVDHPNIRNACSALSAAMFACRLALLGVETSLCTDLARSCILFAEKYMVAVDDGLIIDAIHQEGGSWKSATQKVTHNTGFGIEAFLLFSELTGDRAYFDKATKLAMTSIDPESALFDSTVDLPNRIWCDSTSFAHHLVEALVLVAGAHGVDNDVGKHILSYLTRLAAYIRTHIYDPRDHLYFRELRMYCIDQKYTDRFNEEFGAKQALTALPGDRERGDGPVEKRKLIKTLMANASVARIFLSISDLAKEIAIPSECMEHYRHDMYSTGQGNNRPQKEVDTL